MKRARKGPINVPRNMPLYDSTDGRTREPGRPPGDRGGRVGRPVPGPVATLLVLLLVLGTGSGLACAEPAPGDGSPSSATAPSSLPQGGESPAGDSHDPAGAETGTRDDGAPSAAAPADPGRSATETAATGAAPAPSPVQQPGGEWSFAEPRDHGLDAESVAAGVREIAQQPGVRTLLVVAGGELVVEESWGGASTRRPHNAKSASKSLLSALAGIDLEAGRLPGLEATLGRLLPGAVPDGEGGGPSPTAAVTLRDLLTMTSGLESTSGSHYGTWVASGNWTRAALARPRVADPGEEFVYSTGNTHVLAAVLEEAVDADLLDHARRQLFDPLGIGTVTWQESPEGVRFGGNNLSLAPQDLARFGLLYLQEGRWGERQVVPADWVRESTRHHVDTPPDWEQRYGDYGYLWWLPKDHGGAYVAVGYGGQFVYVAPRAGVVVVLTSTLEGKGTAWDRRVLGIFRDRFAAVEDPAG